MRMKVGWNSIVCEDVIYCGKEGVKRMSAYEIIYEIVKKIPEGKVATYGQIAQLAGNPHWSRVVGYALHCNPTPGEIPCHRVVNRAGKTAKAFAFGGGDVQRSMLENEGVRFLENGCADLRTCQWDPKL